MVKVKIKLDAMLSNQQLQQLAVTSILLTSSIERWTDEQYVYWEGIPPTHPNTAKLLTHDVMRLVLSTGGDVYGMPLWFKVPAELADTAVPAALPNAATTNEKGETVAVTWRDWHDSTHLPVELPDGSLLIASNSFGEELPASVVYSVEGVQVLNVNEYRNELPTQEEV